MRFRANWKQGKVAEDGLIRVHKIREDQPNSCRFEEMTDFQDFNSEEEAKEAIKNKGYSKYKRCKYCWDGKIIEI